MKIVRHIFLLFLAPEKKSKSKEAKSKKRPKLEDDGLDEEENFTNNLSDDTDKDGDQDHTKVVRESERRHANNARERWESLDFLGKEQIFNGSFFQLAKLLNYIFLSYAVSSNA